MLSTKKATIRRNEIKYSSIHGLWFLTGCLSTPKASIPLYIISTQPSRRQLWLNPAKVDLTFGREHKERHERLAQVVKVVALVDPLVALVQAVLAAAHLAQVLPLAVVELALEELHAKNAKNNEKGTTDENNIANLFQ